MAQSKVKTQNKTSQQGGREATMALSTIKELMHPLPQGWAIGAFNINNLDDVKAIIGGGAEEDRSPVILAVSQGL